jgi:YHS domain-containing protein
MKQKRMVCPRVADRPATGTFFTCPVSGGVFEVEDHTRMSFYNGKYYAFCCGGCAQAFKADPEKYVPTS